MVRFKTISLLFVVGLLVGILFAVQFRAPKRINNPVASVNDLKNAKTVLDKDQLDLKQEIKDLRKQITDHQDEVKNNQKTSKAIINQAEELRGKVGLTEKKDKGLVITLADSTQGDITIDSIIHAADIRDVVNTLWQAGAQSISVNDQRLASTTSIDSIINTILINNTKIANPFVIKAIGDQSALTKALAGDQLKDLHRRQKASGLIFNIDQSKEVTVPAFNGGFTINAAKIKDK